MLTGITKGKPSTRVHPMAGALAGAGFLALALSMPAGAAIVAAPVAGTTAEAMPALLYIAQVANGYASTSSPRVQPTNDYSPSVRTDSKGPAAAPPAIPARPQGGGTTTSRPESSRDSRDSGR